MSFVEDAMKEVDRRQGKRKTRREGFITAKEWSEMSDKDIRSSIELGIRVLVDRQRKMKWTERDREYIRSIIEELVSVM